MPPDSTVSMIVPVPHSPAPLLERALGPAWRCLTEAEIRAGGEAGPVDLLALHPRHGAVLVALLRKGETASPEDAAAAFRAMLTELGVAKAFPGEIKIAAIAQEIGRRDQLAQAIREAAGPAPESPPESGWIDWLIPQIVASAPPALRLVAPPEAEEPPAPKTRLQGQRERILPAVSAQQGWRLWSAAVALLSLVLLGAALLVHSGHVPA